MIVLHHFVKIKLLKQLDYLTSLFIFCLYCYMLINRCMHKKLDFSSFRCDAVIANGFSSKKMFYSKDRLIQFQYLDLSFQMMITLNIETDRSHKETLLILKPQIGATKKMEPQKVPLLKGMGFNRLDHVN